MKRKVLFVMIACLCLALSMWAVDLTPGAVQTSCSLKASTGACTTLTAAMDSRGNYPTSWTYTTTVSGTPGALTLNLEGSLDNVAWFTLDSSTTTTTEMRHVVNKPVRYIRGNVATLTGGTSPKVTVVIAGF